MTSEGRKGTIQLLEEFIKCYQSQPCLWDTQSKDYHDKMKKQVAYAKLLRIYQLLEPRADRMTVVKKINILRTNHRKEKKKVKESERSGNGTYVPKLWYYHLFDFLETHKNYTITYNGNEKDDLTAGQQTEAYVDDISESQDTNSSNGLQEVLSSSNQPQKISLVAQDQSPSLLSIDLNIPAKKLLSLTKRNPPDGTETIQQEQENNSKKRKWGDDRYQIFATNVTLKMKDIRNDTQRLLAEKMINEVLFMAEMGQLSMSHCIGLTQNYFGPQTTNCNIGSCNLTYHNPDNRLQTSTVAKSEVLTTSPDCTSDYENEDYQSFNCRNCGRRNSSNLKDNDESHDPLNLLIPKNLT
ncbi:uncharacterized protein LOC115441812 [Manduca sexta]|uniref:uncharacterized protein LOC115441812 n=1 Tax=Manduca sexta TaxID=7130 RepID=UPI00188E1658|nr:uncharacterized protein LOC115441812 [Manduca sexta]